MKNKKGLIGVIAVVLVIFIAGAWFVNTRNSLVEMREDVQLQKSQVETTLQRRSDLIPNLVATVKGYAAHEENVYTEIAEARSKLAGSIENGDAEEIAAANDNLSSAISRLLVVVEQYPELKASEQFIGLQDELAGTENRIAIARQDYNDIVAVYNKQIQVFPASIVAKISGFTDEKYFEADEGSKDAPVVSFE